MDEENHGIIVTCVRTCLQALDNVIKTHETQPREMDYEHAGTR